MSPEMEAAYVQAWMDAYSIRYELARPRATTPETLTQELERVLAETNEFLVECAAHSK